MKNLLYAFTFLIYDQNMFLAVIESYFDSNFAFTDISYMFITRQKILTIIKMFAFSKFIIINSDT